MEAIGNIIARTELYSQSAQVQEKNILELTGAELRLKSKHELATSLGVKIGQAPTSLPELRENLSRVRPLIDKFAKIYQVDEQLIKAIIITESGGDPHAISPAGAYGIMQLKEDIYDPNPRLQFLKTPINPFDPAQALERGIYFLAYLQIIYQGDRDKVIAAYNQGEPRVNRAIKLGHSTQTDWRHHLAYEGIHYLNHINSYLNSKLLYEGLL